MANITNVLEKLWKKFYHIAISFSNKNYQHHLNSEYHIIFNILDELRIETRKTIETIRKCVYNSRPMIFSIDQMEDYIKRIQIANEIMLHLEDLMRKTFDTYIDFINIHWEAKENFEFIEQQKILAEKYDMSMTEWQFILNKIERLNE